MSSAGIATAATQSDVPHFWVLDGVIVHMLPTRQIVAAPGSNPKSQLTVHTGLVSPRYMSHNWFRNVVPRRISQDPGWNSPFICHFQSLLLTCLFLPRHVDGDGDRGKFPFLETLNKHEPNKPCQINIRKRPVCPKSPAKDSEPSCPHRFPVSIGCAPRYQGSGVDWEHVSPVHKPQIEFILEAIGNRFPPIRLSDVVLERIKDELYDCVGFSLVRK